MSNMSRSSTRHDPSTTGVFDKELAMQSEVPLDPSSEVLDGGREAWMTILGTWMIQFCTYGYVSAFGVYQDYYTRSFLSDQSPSNISWIGSFQLFMQYAPGALVGSAFDAGYFHHMIAIGSLLQVISMFMLSLAQPGKYYQVFLAQGVGIGLGQALLFLPSMSIIGQHFKKRRALAMGIAVSGASVGGIIWPIMLNKLKERTSFSNGIRATAAVASVLLLFANLIMKTKTSPQRRAVTTKKSALRTIFSDLPYVISIASAFCISLGLFFPFFYLQLYAVDKGVPNGMAFYSLTLLNAGSVFGRLLPNFFADRLGVYNMLIPCLFISSILVFSIFGVSNFAGIAVFGVLYGFWSGSYVSLIPSLLAQLSSHMGELGTRMGIAFSIVGVSFLIGTPIEGAFLGDKKNYAWHRSIIFCGVMVLCGAVGMIVSRELFVRSGRAGTRGQLV